MKKKRRELGKKLTKTDEKRRKLIKNHEKLYKMDEN